MGVKIMRMKKDFYPRPPRGGRLGMRVVFRGRAKFLSTPSARRATIEGVIVFTHRIFLSTPSARRATAKTEKNISTFVSL